MFPRTNDVISAKCIDPNTFLKRASITSPSIIPNSVFNFPQFPCGRDFQSSIFFGLQANCTQNFLCRANLDEQGRQIWRTCVCVGFISEWTKRTMGHLPALWAEWYKVVFPSNQKAAFRELFWIGPCRTLSPRAHRFLSYLSAPIFFAAVSTFPRPR